MMGRMTSKNKRFIYIKNFIPKEIHWLKHYIITKSRHNNIDKKAIIPNSTIFAHYGIGVVIGENVTFGENCIVRQNCTFGNRHKETSIKIGNNCIFGCGSCILGVVTIGNNCLIGANAVVTKNIPDNCTVIGHNKIIKHKKYINERRLR